ncbi:MAG: DUF177 domain-containing protein [Acidobacteriota bacterium]|nr:DUF177 domain-containing protein [Acidobacteriota bacterium]
MIIDLITLEKSPYAFAYSFAPDEIGLDVETAKLKSVVKVEGELTKRIVQTDVEGEIFAEVETECSRCLLTTDLKLEFSFEAAFITAENYTEAKEAQIKEDDLDVSIFSGDEIDVKELVREQILLNLPEQTFCREDCKGVCEKCGANRNLIDCNCEVKEVDPRWQGLRKLKIKN